MYCAGGNKAAGPWLSLAFPVEKASLATAHSRNSFKSGPLERSRARPSRDTEQRALEGPGRGTGSREAGDQRKDWERDKMGCGQSTGQEGQGQIGAGSRVEIG